MVGVRDRGLLSLGVFLIIVVISIVLYEPVHLISHWSLIPPVVLALFGCWTISLAGMRAANPVRYEREPFSTFAGGLLLLAIGGAWFISIFGWIYSLVVILSVLGVLAIAAALRRR